MGSQSTIGADETENRLVMLLSHRNKTSEMTHRTQTVGIVPGLLGRFAGLVQHITAVQSRNTVKPALIGLDQLALIDATVHVAS